MPAVPVPMTLTQQVADIYAQLKRLRTATSAGGGFDPNADPVVIGLSADGHAQTGAVAIGSYAQTLSGDCVAIGDSAYASGDSNIAIGVSTDVRGDTNIGIGANAHVTSAGSDAIALGSSAWAFDEEAVAIGHGANAIGIYSVAVGPQAEAANPYSTALGFGANASRDHQIMLGTEDEFVEIAGSGLVLTDTATSTRYLVQITSGALVLNTAP